MITGVGLWSQNEWCQNTGSGWWTWEAYYAYDAYARNYCTQQNAYSWSGGNGFNTIGGYMQVVDNAGNVSKKIITKAPRYEIIMSFTQRS